MALQHHVFIIEKIYLKISMIFVEIIYTAMN